MPTTRRGKARAPAVRCYTRALKNARYLQASAPEVFAQDLNAEGFGTGVPLEILRGLHRLPPDSPVLIRYKAVADLLRTSPPPVPGRAARDALFSGTIHFAQITFVTPGGDLVVPAADMNQIVQYAQHAIVPISAYAAQYGPNTVSISPALLTTTVSLSGTSFSDSNLQGWVNNLASSNGFGADHCIFVPVPPGVSAAMVGENSGYHSKAHIPYVVAGVTTGLRLADNADVYAMVVSHEAAEMIVDPNVDGNNPEVCDPCDINCNNLTRCYFDASNNFLGTNQASPPGGFPFTYYACAVAQPAGAADCPAPAADCAYAPPHPQPPSSAGDARGYLAFVPRVVFRAGDGHIHEFSINAVTQHWQEFDMTVATGAAPALGDPQGYLGNVARVVYLATDSHIHEIALNPVGWQSFDMTAATGAPPAAGNPFGYFASVPRVVFRAGNGHIHEFSINPATQHWQEFDMTGI